MPKMGTMFLFSCGPFSLGFEFYSWILVYRQSLVCNMQIILHQCSLQQAWNGSSFQCVMLWGAVVVKENSLESIADMKLFLLLSHVTWSLQATKKVFHDDEMLFSLLPYNEWNFGPRMLKRVTRVSHTQSFSFLANFQVDWITSLATKVFARLSRG